MKNQNHQETHCRFQSGGLGDYETDGYKWWGRVGWYSSDCDQSSYLLKTLLRIEVTSVNMPMLILLKVIYSAKINDGPN